MAFGIGSTPESVEVSQLFAQAAKKSPPPKTPSVADVLKTIKEGGRRVRDQQTPTRPATIIPNPGRKGGTGPKTTDGSGAPAKDEG